MNECGHKNRSNASGHVKMEMSPESRKLGYAPILPGIISVYALVAAWEFVSTPYISHNNTWTGVWVSLLVLPIGALILAKKHPGSGSRFFVYGTVGSLLFLWRFLHMDRFSLWLHYQAPSTMVIVLCWIGFALGMGALCGFFAKVHHW
jgi:hypothetical protein